MQVFFRFFANFWVDTSPVWGPLISPFRTSGNICLGGVFLGLCQLLTPNYYKLKFKGNLHQNINFGTVRLDKKDHCLVPLLERRNNWLIQKPEATAAEQFLVILSTSK